MLELLLDHGLITIFIQDLVFLFPGALILLCLYRGVFLLYILIPYLVNKFDNEFHPENKYRYKV